MPTDQDRLRRYLLGETDDAGSEAIERDYFAREEMLDEVASAEDDLIDDYLTGRLAEAPRRRFETHYLASRVHRRRLATVRGLRQRGAPRRSAWRTPLMSLAAALVVALLGAFFWQRGTGPGGAATVSVTLPSILLRDGGATTEAHLGSAVITLALRFEAGALPATPPLEAEVRTLDGAAIWRGPATPLDAAGAAGPRLVASADVPAAALSGGDYVVVLFSRADGAPRELQRSALRVVRE